MFRNCWVWVDFYFILTGAFSYRHYQIYTTTDKGYGNETLSYTIKKFRRFFPLTIVAVIIQYCFICAEIVNQGGIPDFLNLIFSNAMFEVMYLSSSGITSAAVAPIWFLSAMFIAMPISIYMIQAHPELWEIVAFTVPIIYFGYKGVNTDRAWPNDMIRAFVCMAIGTISYLLACYIRKKYESRLSRILLSLCEIAALLLAICISVFNRNYLNIIEFLFFVLCTLMFSQLTWSAGFYSKCIKVLGEISMPMFILHWGAGSIACILTDNLMYRTVIYYLSTLLISLAWVKIINLKRRKHV